VLSPVFVAFFMWETLAGRIVCLSIAVCFEITDLLDGHFARSRKEVSDVGKLLDPFADSVSRFSVLLSFAMAGYAHLWMIALIFYRDITVANIRLAAMKTGTVVAARSSGKIKAVVQGAGILCMLALLVISKAGAVKDTAGIDTAVFWIMAVITAVTALSGIDYIAGNRGIIASLGRESS
jgi:CDP-diacylglycerol--glycerol-3-phosphate 3-phosphatidyltransferase